jgi:hypothetical protein
LLQNYHPLKSLSRLFFVNPAIAPFDTFPNRARPGLAPVISIPKRFGILVDFVPHERTIPFFEQQWSPEAVQGTPLVGSVTFALRSRNLSGTLCIARGFFARIMVGWRPGFTPAIRVVLERRTRDLRTH